MTGSAVKVSMPVRPQRCAAAVLALAVSVNAAEPLHLGALIFGVPHQYNNEWAIANLEDGAVRLLPRSRTTTHSSGWDLWSGTTTRELVRVSSGGDIEFFDRATLGRTGGFTLAGMPGTDRPAIFGAAMASPDGRHVLAYWKPDWHSREPEIAVFDRNGTVVQNGSPFKYDALRVRSAIAWLPDSRHYVYLTDDKIVVREVGSDSVWHLPLRLPAGVGTANSELAVSPDGKRLALSLATDLPNGKGLRTGYNLIFIASLDGSGMRQLTGPSERVQRQGISMGHESPSWSPDGRWLIFTQRESSPYGGMSLYSNSRCTNVIAVPVDAAVHAVDGRDDPTAMVLHAGKARVVSCEQVQWLAP